MRNSEAQKYARWSAIAALVLALVVAAVYLHRSWVVRQAAKAAPPAVPAAVEQQSSEFSFSKVTGERIVFTVRASRQTEFKQDDRNLLQDVSIDIFGPQGQRHDTMRTQACDFMSSTGKITCAGDVQIDLQAAGDGAASHAIEVMTSHVTFDRDSGETQTTSPVNFRWPGGQGHATGADYNSGNGTLRLDHDVQMTITPEAKNPQLQNEPLQITGASMVFDRTHQVVQMIGNVHAQQSARELTAAAMRLELDAKLHARLLTATGAAQDRPQLRDTANGSAIDVAADEMSAVFTPEGAVNSVTSSGNVQGSRKDAMNQDNLQAARVQLDFAREHNTPRLLTADGGVLLRSSPLASGIADGNGAGDVRTLQTKALQVHFATNERMPGMLKSVNTLAPATVEWQSTVASATGPVPQTLSMRGQIMNMTFGARNQLQQMTSSGGVGVTRQLGSGPEQISNSRDLTAKFTNGEWTTVDQTGNVRFEDGLRMAQGDRAHLDRAADTMTLTGAVVVSDAATWTTAQSAAFTRDINEFRADGHVLTTSVPANGSGPASRQAATVTSAASNPQAVHVSAAQVVVNTQHGHAVYTGSCRFWQGASLVEADKMDLDSPSQTVVAEGHVRGVFPQAAASSGVTPVATLPTPKAANSLLTSSPNELWRVAGGRLTYWSAESRARLEEKASAESKDNSIDADQIDLHFTSAANTLQERQLTSALASGAVHVRQGDRQGSAESATYTASEGKFVLSGGKPTVYDASGDTVNGRELTFFFSDDRIVVDSEKGSRTVTLHRVEK